MSQQKQQEQQVTEVAEVIYISDDEEEKVVAKVNHEIIEISDDDDDDDDDDDVNVKVNHEIIEINDDNVDDDENVDSAIASRKRSITSSEIVGESSFRPMRKLLIFHHVYQYGEIKSAIGTFYRGQILRGKPHGKGFMVCRDYVYHGEWKDGKKCGMGCMYYHTGKYIEGKFCDNLLTRGQAVIRYAHGVCFEGACKFLKPNGKGKVYYPDGTKRIEKVFVDFDESATVKRARLLVEGRKREESEFKANFLQVKPNANPYEVEIAWHRFDTNREQIKEMASAAKVLMDLRASS